VLGPHSEVLAEGRFRMAKHMKSVNREGHPSWTTESEQLKRTPKISTPPTAPQTTEPIVDLQEQARRRAYEISEKRGRQDGHELEDWLQAEAEMLQQGEGKQLPRRSALFRTHRIPVENNERRLCFTCAQLVRFHQIRL